MGLLKVYPMLLLRPKAKMDKMKQISIHFVLAISCLASINGHRSCVGERNTYPRSLWNVYQRADQPKKMLKFTVMMQFCE